MKKMNLSEIIAVTRCLRILPKDKGIFWGDFHFIGVWQGYLVRQIKLKLPRDEPLSVEVGGEYIITLQVFSVERGSLKGEALQITPLSLREFF